MLRDCGMRRASEPYTGQLDRLRLQSQLHLREGICHGCLQARMQYVTDACASLVCVILAPGGLIISRVAADTQRCTAGWWSAGSSHPAQWELAWASEHCLLAATPTLAYKQAG